MTPNTVQEEVGGGGGWGGGSSTWITFSSPETQRVPNVLTRIVDRDLSRWIALSTFWTTGAGEKSNLVHNRGSQIVPFLCYFLPQIISRFVSKGVRFQQLKVLKILWTRKVRRKGSRKCSVESGKFTGSFEKRTPAWILDYLKRSSLTFKSISQILYSFYNGS